MVSRLQFISYTKPKRMSIELLDVTEVSRFSRPHLRHNTDLARRANRSAEASANSAELLTAKPPVGLRPARSIAPPGKQ